LEVVLFGVLVAVAALTVLARRIDVPYPILLVIGGLALGFVPGLPDVALDPDIVLVIFLPPLLYSAAFFSSLRDLRRDMRPISLLAIGLVLVTTVTVAVVAHAVIDDLPWAAAFALGAIVSPTDPVAATAIIRRVGAPRRLATIVEGEALVNDAVALVAYKVAVAAAVGGSFSLANAGMRFVLGALGGVAIGLAVGWLVTRVRKSLEDPPVEITISLLTAYAAYLPAEELGASGVLAAVTTGIYLGWNAPSIASSATRMQAYAVWDILTYLLNATLFVLVGLQLAIIVDPLSGSDLRTLLGYAAIVSGVVVGTRLLWQFTVVYLIRLLDRRESVRARRATWRVRVVSAWSGMRGAVSLAAALALPLETDAGSPFPQRDAIIVITFGVIFVTLVLQGLTLPLVIRRLGVHDDGIEERNEELRARISAATAAIEEIDRLEDEEWTRDETLERMRRLYDYRRRRFKAQAGKVEDDGFEDRSLSYQRAVQSVISAQRRALVGLRNRGEIPDDVMRRVERELDLEESRLEIDAARDGLRGPVPDG
jgi:CPA1 family monovalent cation:H+ antiporter